MKLIEYIKDVRGELKHVSWPTRKQSLVFAIIVIVISVATSFYLGFFDFVFTKLLQNFVI